MRGWTKCQETISVNSLTFLLIDFALGLPNKKGIISGMRESCEVVVEINMVKAIYEGKIPFYISENFVVLTPGDEQGSLKTKYCVNNYLIMYILDILDQW